MPSCRRKKTGGVGISSTAPLTNLDDKMIGRILQVGRCWQEGRGCRGAITHHASVAFDQTADLYTHHLGTPAPNCSQQCRAGSQLAAMPCRSTKFTMQTSSSRRTAPWTTSSTSSRRAFNRTRSLCAACKMWLAVGTRPCLRKLLGLPLQAQLAVTCWPVLRSSQKYAATYGREVSASVPLHTDMKATALVKEGLQIVR